MERNIHVKSHFHAKHKMHLPYLTCLQSATPSLKRTDVICVFVDDCLKVPYGVSTVNSSVTFNIYLQNGFCFKAYQTIP